MLYTVVDVIDHSIMKESVLDLIDNMPSKERVFTINLDDDYTDLEYDYASHISKTNWQDEIFGEEWVKYAAFLSPTDQFQVVNSIKIIIQIGIGLRVKLLRVGLINILQSLDLKYPCIIMRIARKSGEKIHV